MTDLKLYKNKTINVPIEKVFDAWLDPKMLSIFMMPMPGMPKAAPLRYAAFGIRLRGAI